MNLRLTHFYPLTILTVAVVITSSSTVNGATPTRGRLGAAWKTVDCKTFDCKTFDVPASVAARRIVVTSPSPKSTDNLKDQRFNLAWC